MACLRTGACGVFVLVALGTSSTSTNGRLRYLRCRPSFARTPTPSGFSPSEATPPTALRDFALASKPPMIDRSVDDVVVGPAQDPQDRQASNSASHVSSRTPEHLRTPATPGKFEVMKKPTDRSRRPNRPTSAALSVHVVRVFLDPVARGAPTLRRQPDSERRRTVARIRQRWVASLPAPARGGGS